MKNFISLLSITLLFSCNPPGSGKETADNKVTEPASLPDSAKKRTDTLVSNKTDSVSLMQTATEVLMTCKARDYKKLASYMHPQNGTRFYPYSGGDTAGNRNYSGDELVKLAKENKKVNWNSDWAEGEELLTVNQYFSKFVYDVDFLNATLKSINNFHTQSAIVINLKELYPGCDAVEFFFPGFKKDMGGMDYAGLRLVFKTENNIHYLVAVQHDTWTP